MKKELKEWSQKKWEELLAKLQGIENVSTPQDKKVTFLIMFDEKHIGTLDLDNGKWTFTYSSYFKHEYLKPKSASKENKPLLAPLFGFPDVDKKYKSDFLWPFFAGRIPGLKQPEIEEIIERERIDKTDIVALLTRFGRKTIANPFELKPA